MRRTLTTWLTAMKHRLLAACGSGLVALGLSAGLAAQEPQSESALLTAVHRISDDDEPAAAPAAYADASYGVPYGAQPAAGGAGYFYSSYNNLMGGGSYFDATGGRAPNTWAGEWGYGNDCHVGAARVEYLMWFSRGRNSTPLVTTSPINTPQTQAGVLGVPTTDVTYGGDEPIGENMRSGARITLSRLLADECTWVEGRFWGVEDSTERFFADENDFPILARPFFNTTLGVEDSLLVNFPGIAAGGSVNVLSKNDMFSAEAWIRRTWSDDGCTRLDWLAGYQFARIDDFISINNTMTSVDPLASLPIGTILSNTDAFQTQNEFHGGSVGFVIDRRKGCWSLEVLGKIGLGNMRQRVAISGRTDLAVPNIPPLSQPSGLLAQPSNIGVDERNQFCFVPEVNINLCYNLSPSWRLLGGYTFIYYSDVVLAANQIDRAVNLSQVPGPPVGPLAPLFSRVNSDFLIQGINLGAEYRW